MEQFTFREKEAIKIYLKLMVEFRIRSDLVNIACNGRLGLTLPYAREYCYFQFRRMCEIMALGCLILHEDIKETQSNNIREIWNAQKIMKLLGKLHQHFFQQSITRDSKNNQHNIVANSVQGAMTKDKFHRLYNECGEVLHRGSVKSIEMEIPPQKEAYDKLINWHKSLIALMNEHVIVRATGNDMYMISLLTVSGGPECSLLMMDPKNKSQLNVSSFKFRIEN